jgi:choline dehydrogenase-like flavoprotein
MILSASQVPRDTLLHADVCIVGAGAAGVTLALELTESSGLEVVLLESGDYSDDGQSTNLLAAEISNPANHYPLNEARIRLLGGTTSAWGGRCLPYDPIDFEYREHVPYSGWPIHYEAMERYYERAHTYCQCGRYSYQVDAALPDAPGEVAEGFVDGSITSRHIERWSVPTHFGSAYLETLKSRKNLQVVLNATCSHIATRSDDARVESLSVHDSLGRKTFRVKAHTYVLAGGGLEVTRLLLASNDVHHSGIGNQSDSLGRFYMGHISGAISRIQFTGDPKHTIYSFERDPDGVYCRRRFWVTPEAQLEHRLLNTVFWLENPPMADASHGNSVMSLAYLALTAPLLGKYLAPGSMRTAATSRGVPSSKWKHMQNLVRDLPSAVQFMPGFLYRRYLAARKIPGFMLPSGSNRYDLHYHAEQIPNPDSRVTLSGHRDSLGIPWLRIDYRYTEQDVDSVVRAHRLFAAQLKDTGSGSLAFISAEPETDAIRNSRDGLHQLGTTRMSADPNEGVVDTNCRVFGTSNLYVASSSVFPTAGQANPTLTIVALAIRLADFLKRSAQ